MYDWSCLIRFHAATIDPTLPINCADIFKKYEYDFFKIDPNLFSPAQAFVINLKTGKTFQSGSIDEELMKKSFNL